MELYTTPPETPSDDERDALPPVTSPKSPRPKCLQTAIFWELTDRRHYPPSPGTGLTLFSPVPYPYNPSSMPASPEANSENNTTFDGPASAHDPMIIDPNTLAQISADMKEALREAHHENGYPVASSPSSRKLLRTSSSTPSPSTQDTTPEDLATSIHLSHHLSALDISSDSRTHFSLSAKHLSRKSRIRNSKTVQRSAPYMPRERYKDNMEVNMWQLQQWADEDEEKKILVGRILHARGEERTSGLRDPFAAI